MSSRREGEREGREGWKKRGVYTGILNSTILIAMHFQTVETITILPK